MVQNAISELRSELHNSMATKLRDAASNAAVKEDDFRQIRLEIEAT